MTSTSGVNARKSDEKFGNPLSYVSLETHTHRSGAARVAARASSLGSTARRAAQNPGTRRWIWWRSLSLIQGGRCGPSLQGSFVAAGGVGSAASSPSRGASSRGGDDSSPSSRRLRAARSRWSATARLMTSAQIGTVLERLSGNRFVALRVASTTRHPRRLAAASATCRLSLTALKLQLLQWPSVDLK